MKEEMIKMFSETIKLTLVLMFIFICGVMFGSGFLFVIKSNVVTVSFSQIERTK